MRTAFNARGYTIIEVLIVFAVSSIMVTSVMALINGKQQRQQFETDIRNAQTEIQDVVNDTQTSFYDNNQQVGCDAGADTGTGQPDINTTSPPAQGKNYTCIFLGKAIQFYGTSPTAPIDQARAIAIAGRRKSAGHDVKNITEAKPIALSDENAYQPEQLPISDNLEYRGARFADVPGSTVLSPALPSTNLTFALISGLQATNENGSAVASADSRVSLFKLNVDHSADPNKTKVNQAVTGLGGAGITPAYGAVLCFREAGGGRPAAMLIGLQIEETTGNLKTTGQLSVESYFDDNARAVGCS